MRIRELWPWVASELSGKIRVSNGIVSAAARFAGGRSRGGYRLFLSCAALGVLLAACNKSMSPAESTETPGYVADANVMVAVFGKSSRWVPLTEVKDAATRERLEALVELTAPEATGARLCPGKFSSGEVPGGHLSVCNDGETICVVFYNPQTNEGVAACGPAD